MAFVERRTPSSSPNPFHSNVGPNGLPVVGCLWGMFANADGNKSKLQNMAAAAALLRGYGRTNGGWPAAARYYPPMNQGDPVTNSNASGQDLGDMCRSGVIPLPAWPNGSDGTTIPSIVAGTLDASITAAAQNFAKCKTIPQAALGGLVWLCPFWEFNLHSSVFSPDVYTGGNPADFITAFQRVVSLFAAAGADNVRFCLNIAHKTTDAFTIAQRDPGAQYYQAFGIDAYNRQASTVGNPPGGGDDLFTTLADRVYGSDPAEYSARRGTKPLIIAECGTGNTGDYTGGAPVITKDKWIANAAAAIKARPEVKMYVQFDANHVAAEGYDYTMTSIANPADACQPAAQNAFGAMAADAYFNPAGYGS